jgi:NADPH:quinone reductase-like Zn-dependent oxidoreductase
MRTYELRGKGIATLSLVDRPAPRPGPGQVLVRVRAASLNYRDLLIARGTYPFGAPKLPLVPLSDGAGTVVELGAGVTRPGRGERVIGAFFQRWIDGPLDADKAASALGGAIDGVLAEHAIFEAAAAVELPESLSFEEGATLPCAGVTAWVSLMELGRLGPGETVLVMGTGGVSSFALQLAKLGGARVILTSSRDDKLARGKALGADEVINYRTTPDWDVRARELTGGRGVDHLVEVGGAATLPVSARAVRDGGHLTLVGLLGGQPADLADARARYPKLRIDSVYVGSVRQLERLVDRIARTGTRPVIDQLSFAFDDAIRAYEHLASGAHFGKVVIRV